MKYLICCFFVFYLFSNSLLGQSIIENGSILFEKNKEQIELQEDVYQLINSFSNRIESKSLFEYRSEIYMYALLFENHQRFNESIQLLNYLSKDLNIDKTHFTLDFIKIQFKMGLLYKNIDVLDSANIKFEECVLLLKESFGINNEI